MAQINTVVLCCLSHEKGGVGPLITMRLKLSKGAGDTKVALWVEIMVGSARELHVPAAQMPTMQILPDPSWLRQLCRVLNCAA